MVSDDLAVLQSIFTNFGTGFVSAGLLLLLEPQVREAVRNLADDAVEEATSKVSEKFDAELKDLRAQINEGIQDQASRQDKAVEAFADGTYDSALAAMKSVAGVGALDHDQIAVEGTDQPGEFTISLAIHPLTTSEDSEKGILRIMVETGNESVVETWRPSAPFGEFAVSLMTLLTSKKAWGYSNADPLITAHERLGRALELALTSQREDKGAMHLQGRLAAVIADGLYLTDRGLESPQHDYLLPRTEFPQQLDLTSQGHSERPSKPEWIDEATWDFALTRCRDRFTTSTLGSRQYADPTLVPREPYTPPF